MEIIALQAPAKITILMLIITASDISLQHTGKLKGLVVKYNIHYSFGTSTRDDLYNSEAKNFPGPGKSPQMILSFKQ